MTPVKVVKQVLDGLAPTDTQKRSIGEHIVVRLLAAGAVEDWRRDPAVEHPPVRSLPTETGRKMGLDLSTE